MTDWRTSIDTCRASVGPVASVKLTAESVIQVHMQYDALIVDPLHNIATNIEEIPAVVVAVYQVAAYAAYFLTCTSTNIESSSNAQKAVTCVKYIAKMLLL